LETPASQLRGISPGWADWKYSSLNGGVFLKRQLTESLPGIHARRQSTQLRAVANQPRAPSAQAAEGGSPARQLFLYFRNNVANTRIIIIVSKISEQLNTAPDCAELLKLTKHGW
jgi:hypothetical protein